MEKLYNKVENDVCSWIEYKNRFARLEAEQEQKAFKVKINYEMSLNRVIVHRVYL